MYVHKYVVPYQHLYILIARSMEAVFSSRMLLLLLLVVSSTAQSTTTTTELPTTTEGPTTTAPSYYVELRGGSEDEYWVYGNVYAVNSYGYFGPVCDDGWGEAEARVVCNQLGYPYGTFECRSHWGDVPGTFSMDEVYCNGHESHLQDCQYRTIDNCYSHEGAGVWCGKHEQPTHGDYPGGCDYVSTTSTWQPQTTTTWPPETSTSWPDTTTEWVPCPDGWVDFGASGCFLLSTEVSGVTWWEAAVFCEEQVTPGPGHS